MKIKVNTHFSTISVGAIILLLISLYNGFPLVYSDTGTYIASGFDAVIPPDRPIMYGFFIKVISLKYSLWLVVIVQNYLTAFLIYEIFKLFKLKNLRLTYLLTIWFLTLFTSIGWYSNQIMPDFFTPIIFLSFFLLLFNSNYSIIKKSFLSLIIVFASTTHFSHLLIDLLLAFSVFIIYAKKKRKGLENEYFFSLKKTISIGFILIAGWIVLIVINYTIESKPIISKGGHVFLIGNLIDKNILKPFLDENCTSEEFKDCKLCELKETLPSDGSSFIWSLDIIEKSGGWIGSKEEYNKIILATYKQPKYLFDNIYQSFVFGLIQLTRNSVGEGLSTYGIDSAPWGQINWRFKNEVNNYLNSKQNKWDGVNLNFENFTFLQWVVLIASLFILIIAFSSSIYKNINKLSRWFLFYSIIMIIINAFITAGLTSPYSRLQSRTIWLLPFAIIILIVSNYSYLKSRFKKKFLN